MISKKIGIFILAFLSTTLVHSQELTPHTQHFLKKLVEINSGTENVAGQHAVRELIKSEFAQYGFVATEIELPAAQNTVRKMLVLNTPDSSGEVVLLGHTDTVFAPDSPFQQFKIEHEKIYGPGIIDMKGGIALIGDILNQLNESERKHIQVIFNDDEETGSVASNAKLIELTRAAKVVLVFEPGLPDGSVVTSESGLSWYVLDVKGKPSHAGLEPEKGFSACTELSYKVIKAAALSDLANGINVNPGVIKGGTKPNVVCEQASVQLDIRYTKPAQLNQLEHALHKIADTVYSQHIPANFFPSTTVTHDPHRPPLAPEKTARLFSIFSDVAKNFSLQPNGQHVGYGSDGNNVSVNNAEILVGLGPYGGGMHTQDEFLSTKSYAERLKVDTAFIKELLKF